MEVSGHPGGTGTYPECGGTVDLAEHAPARVYGRLSMSRDQWPDEVPDWIADPADELRVANHWVPRTHLTKFADDGLLWMYRRDEPDEPVQLSPRRAAVENGLYVVPEDAPLEPRDAMERLLEYIERPYPRVRRWLIKGRDVGLAKQPPWTQWVGFCLFLAMQYVRTPYWRDYMQQMMSFYGTFQIRSKLEDIDRAYEEYARGEDGLSKDELRKFRDRLDAGELEVGPHESAWLGLIGKAAIEIADEIVDRPWRVVRAPEGVAFPTSDMPVVVARLGRDGYKLGGGIATPGTQITYPLTPKQIFVMGAGVQDDNVGSEGWCATVTNRMCHHSTRFVFAPARNPQIGEVLRRTEPPELVLEFAGEERSLLDPVGPLAKDLLESRARYIRFGAPGPPTLE